MLTHDEVWLAIDRLAANHKMSPSGLARRAGMDPTTFNKSKRTTRDGKDRWPSTESVAKILKATGASLSEFIDLINGKPSEPRHRRVPLIRQSTAVQGGHFDLAGKPVGEGWDEILFPSMNEAVAYALEINDPHLEPVYRPGDTVLISPDASLRRGDRVVVHTINGNLLIRRLMRESALKVELIPVNGEAPMDVLDTDDVRWTSRIIWSSQ